MNWFNGCLIVHITNGNTLRIFDVPFNKAGIKAALEARVRPQSVKELIYEPSPISIEIPEEFKA